MASVFLQELASPGLGPPFAARMADVGVTDIALPDLDEDVGGSEVIASVMSANDQVDHAHVHELLR